MDFHVLIRESLDWNHATYADLKNDFVRQVVRQWDSAFNVTFMDCRARLKIITLDSLKMLSPVQIHELPCFDVSVLEPEDVLLICDDDDWYHPGMVEHLRGYLNAHRSLKYHFVLWPDGVFGCTHYKVPLGTPLGLVPKRALDKGSHIVKTNNYAVAGRFLCSEPERQSVVLRHGDADHYLKLADQPVIKLTTPLSMVNRHPLCQSVWQLALRPTGICEWSDVLRKLAHVYIQRPTLQPLFPWAHGYIDRTKAVFREALGM